MDVTACRITGVLTRSMTQMRSMLDASAVPFIPRQLKNVFCTFGMSGPHVMLPYAGFPHPDVYTSTGFVMTSPPACLLTDFDVLSDKRQLKGSKVSSSWFVSCLTYQLLHPDNVSCIINKNTVHESKYDDDDVSFYNSNASTWTLATPRSTWESLGIAFLILYFRVLLKINNENFFFECLEVTR